MALLYSRDLTTGKKVTSSGARPDARDYYWFRTPVPRTPEQAFADMFKTFRSLYSHALLIIAKSSQFL